MIIHGGTGNGYAAKVNPDNKLEARCVIVSDEHYKNHAKGLAFQAVCNQKPTAAGDCIFYLENTSPTLDMVVEGICIGVSDCTAADQIYFEHNTSGTRNSGTAVTPVNMNTTSNRVAEATCEKGADLDGGSATLTTGSEFFRIILAGISDLRNNFFNFEMDLILGYGKALTVWIAGSNTGTYYINVPFYFAASGCDD